ncbi:metallophosphoesterase family protein [Dactylosporangium sp. CA-233914]|uniref:metallophosphoesterase family protein n=1 Tax=Dactylosporangium sp. CA-233914 TaxID=3239934 RepID=UPI003D90A7E3
MKIGLISDIHGNPVALDATLDALASEGVDQIACLGDIAYGPCPHQTLARVREACVTVVAGNGDTWLADPGAVEREPALRHRRLKPVRDQHVAALAWARAQLTDDDLAYLGGLPLTAELPLNAAHTLLCFHGSPRHNYDFILPTTSQRDIDDMLGGRVASVLASGHSHQQMLRRHHDFTLVNVGSVGRAPIRFPWPVWLPDARDLPDEETHGEYRAVAEYVVITATDDAISIEFKQLALDAERVLAMTADSGIPGGTGYFGELRPLSAAVKRV